VEANDLHLRRVVTPAMALETVLVAVDRPDEGQIESLVSTVTDLAGPAAADVLLLHAFTRESYDESVDRLDFEDASDADVDTVASRLNGVRGVAGGLDDGGLEVEIKGAIGEAGETIVGYAEKEGADLVVVGGRNRSPTGKAVFGSTAQEVMLNAHCPVTFVRTG